ncbi:putative integral membrane protein [Lachnospiraceae bacterium JC7]|nr:putative integral membrane protein [Lachnospiraceae bacterium JC7]
MMTISQIKSFARRQLKGNWLSAVGVLLLTLICFTLWTTVISLVMVIGIFGPLTGRIQLFDLGQDQTVRMFFFAVVGIMIAALIFIGLYLGAGFMLGTQMFYLDMAKGKQVDAFCVFKGFSDMSHFKHYFGVLLILYAIEFILMIPLGIIGVRYGVRSTDYRITNHITSIVIFVVMLFLNMSTFASADNRELKTWDAIKVSLRLMRYRKLKFVLLELSFILWFMLAAISCGLATFIVIPYFNASLSVFYLSAYDEEYRTGTGETYDVPEQTGKDSDQETCKNDGDQDIQNAEYTEPKDTYVKGDAVPENEAKRSFEEVRRQYTCEDDDKTRDDKTEEDTFSAYEQWKKDHGITMDNRDPFHGKYQDKKGE